RFKCDWSSDVCSSDLRLAGQVHVAAKMTKPAMAVGRRYVDAATDRFRARRQDTVTHGCKRPDQFAKLGIDAINRPARPNDLPPSLEAIPCLVDLLIARAQDRFEVPDRKSVV